MIRDIFAPVTIDEAVGMLEEHGSKAWVLAGGTDVMVRIRRGMMPDTALALMSVHRLEMLKGTRVEAGTMVIGAATTATGLREDPLVAEHAPILATVADRMASTQIRNLATVGGNLANASPAGDLINPLLLLDAEVVLVSSGGDRTVPVVEFFTGPGETVRRPTELLKEVRFTIPQPERVFRFEKAGTRPAMECSVVTVGLAYTPVDGKATDVRVAFGSAAPTPLRGRETEAVLEGAALTDETIQRAAGAAGGEVSPISDVRGSADYRRVLVAEFVRRLLHGR